MQQLFMGLLLSLKLAITILFYVMVIKVAFAVLATSTIIIAATAGTFFFLLVLIATALGEDLNL